MNEFTRNPGTPLNLDGTFTLEEYERVLWRVVEAGRLLAEQYGWCSQWLSTLVNLSEDFTNYPYDKDRYDDDGGWLDPADIGEHGGVDVQLVSRVQPRELFTDEGWTAYQAELGKEYARRLRAIWGRLLAVVHGDGDTEGTVELDAMNDVFTYIGFPRYEPQPATQFVEVGINRTLYFILPVHIPEDEIGDRIRQGIDAFVESMGADLVDEDGDPVHVADVYDWETSHDENDTQVLDGDVVELLHRA